MWVRRMYQRTKWEWYGNEMVAKKVCEYPREKDVPTYSQNGKMRKNVMSVFWGDPHNVFIVKF